MFPDQYFYNKSLRKLVVGFGSLFSNIYVEHPNQNDEVNTQIRVPITYAPQEKFIRRLLEPSSIDNTTRIENQLPRLSYMMSSISVDNVRKMNKLTPIESPDTSSGSCLSTGSLINEVVPVNVSFSLFVYTRHIDDTLQIFEQIIPYFSPDHIISLDMNDVQTDVRIPITMLNNSMTERFDGDFSGRRINISSINFMAKSFIYGKIQSFTKITSSDINLDVEF
jgi:hypothetical protein